MTESGKTEALPVKLTRVNRRRLLVLLTDAANLGGSTIWRLAGGSAGWLYVFLAKLEDAGLVTSEWEAPEPLDRPRRRFYRLTPEGRAAAMQRSTSRRESGDDERHPGFLPRPRRCPSSSAPGSS